MNLAVDASAPVVRGRSYNVPCIHYTWHARLDWWPVLGPRHKDKAFLGFGHWHYHIDGRFLTADQRRHVRRQWAFNIVKGDIASIIEAFPLNQISSPLPEAPTLRHLKCWRADIGHYQHSHQPGIHKIAMHFAGRRCPSSDHGWVCPHQATPLGSIKPVDGVITCPLHGLRIDAATGVVISPGPSATGKERENE